MSLARRRAAMEQHYVGLDVGLEETSLCIVDSEGKTVREVKVATAALLRATRIASRASEWKPHRWGRGCTGSCKRKGCRSLPWKPVTCGCRYRRCVTKPTGTMRVALRR